MKIPEPITTGIISGVVSAAVVVVTFAFIPMRLVKILCDVSLIGLGGLALFFCDLSF